MRLQKGKLTGLFVALSPTPGAKQELTRDFFEAVEAGEWDEAVSMLFYYERDFLTDEDGKLKSAFKPRLQSLDRGDWKAFLREQLKNALHAARQREDV